MTSDPFWDKNTFLHVTVCTEFHCLTFFIYRSWICALKPNIKWLKTAYTLKHNPKPLTHLRCNRRTLSGEQVGLYLHIRLILYLQQLLVRETQRSWESIQTWRCWQLWLFYSWQLAWVTAWFWLNVGWSSSFKQALHCLRIRPMSWRRVSLHLHPELNIWLEKLNTDASMYINIVNTVYIVNTVCRWAYIDVFVNFSHLYGKEWRWYS